MAQPLCKVVLRFLKKIKIKLHACILSHFSHVQLFATLWTVAYQAPLSMGFYRQEYCSGLPFPPPGDLPNPGIKPKPPTLQADCSLLSHWGSPKLPYILAIPLLDRSVKELTPVLWPPDAKSWLIGKDSDAGRDWGQEEKEMTEDEMAGWHHRLDGRESEWTPGVGDGQGGLACCNSWGPKESDTTERLNWTELNVNV